MSNLLKHRGLAKAFTVATSVATVLSMSGVMYFAPVASAVTPADFGLHEGDTISVDGLPSGDPLFDPDIYIVNDWGYKRLFLNPVIFSFYGHLGGFAAVKHVSPTARDAFGTSGLFRDCEAGSVNNNGKVYGVEVQGEDVGLLHWVNTTGAQAVADDANFFLKVFCINDNEFNWYTNNGTRFGTDYTSVNQVPQYYRSQPVNQANGVTVSLASDNPVAGTIVNGQARYDLAHFMFSGSGTVTSVKLKRIGVSADATLTNVYLYEGTRRLTDAVTVSDSTMLFNDAAGLFTLSGSKVISVVADVSGTAGETVGVQVVAVNGVNLSSAVSGNLHTIAAASLATLTFGSVTPSDGDTSGDDDDNGNTAPGSDIPVWQSTATVGTRYVWLKSLQMRVIGSVLAGDVRNFRLYVDGVQAGSAVAQQDANGYVVFDTSSNPVKLETGGRVLKVLADIVGGSSKEFYLSIRQKSDVWAVDSQYNAAVNSSSTFPIGTVDNDIEIDTGSITFTKKTDSPSGDVIKDASGVVLARFEAKAAGEKMKVENLRINFTAGNDTNLEALRNAALFADGVQVGSTTTLWEDSTTGSNSTAYSEISLGSSLIVVPGTPRVLEIRADIFDSNGVNDISAGDTLTANIAAGSSNVQRMTTLDYISGPTGVTTGNTVTVQTGSFSAGKYTAYANQSVVAPKTGVKLAHFTLTAASSEDVAVNTLILEVVESAAGSLSNDFTDAYAKVWNDAGAVVYTSATKSVLTASAAGAASNSYSVNFTIPKNKTYQVEFWTNVASSFDSTSPADTASTKFKATGTTVGSSTSVTATQVAGQTITAAGGSLTRATGTLPVSRFQNGGSTASLYNFTLTPTYDDFILDEVYVDIASTSGTLLASSSGAVASVILKDGSTTLATAVLNSSTGSASFTGLNYPLNQSNGTKALTVDVQFAGVGVGANDTAGKVQIQLDGLKYRNSGGSITTTTGIAHTGNVGNAMYAVKSFPTFTNASLPSTQLTAGTLTLFKTVLAANGGQVGWNDIRFQVASSSLATTITSFLLYENGVDTGATASVSDTGTTTRVEFTFASERSISSGGSVTLELRGTVGGALSAGNSVTTQLANPSGTTVTTDDATTQALGNVSFVWSDQSAPSHATTTDDWFTDGLVKTLAESQSLVY